MSEFVTLVNQRDEILGSKERSLLTDNDRWRIVTIWLENSAGDILLAQRSMAKKNNPGKWGPAAAGTVEHGDSYDETAHRELQEELGISLPLRPKGLFMHDSMIGKRADMGYVGLTDASAEDFIIQQEEVERVKWIGKEALREDFASRPGEYIMEFAGILEFFMNTH